MGPANDNGLSRWTRLPDWWSDFDVWNAPLFTIGGTPVTLLHLLALIALTVALIVIAARW